MSVCMACIWDCGLFVLHVCDLVLTESIYGARFTTDAAAIHCDFLVVHSPFYLNHILQFILKSLSQQTVADKINVCIFCCSSAHQ